MVRAPPLIPITGIRNVLGGSFESPTFRKNAGTVPDSVVEIQIPNAGQIPRFEIKADLPPKFGTRG
jgi:hypothetical protein